MAQEVSRITESILKSSKQPAFIPFIVSGFPDLESTKLLIRTFEENGAAALELGIPHSDPLADGPVIQKASKQALENGVNPDKIFEMLEQLTDTGRMPIILFTYFNPVLRYGIENFIKRAVAAGVSGLIIPDLPLEESSEVSKLCKSLNLDLIMLVSPASGPERTRNIAMQSSGFIYLVSSTGVTGVRSRFSEGIEGICRGIRDVTDTPIAVGFGVSQPEHILELRELGVNGAIIGSAIIKIIEKYGDNRELLVDNINKYIKTLYKGV